MEKSGRFHLKSSSGWRCFGDLGVQRPVKRCPARFWREISPCRGEACVLICLSRRVPTVCDFEPLNRHVDALHHLVQAAQSVDEMSQTITDLLSEQRVKDRLGSGSARDPVYTLSSCPPAGIVQSELPPINRRHPAV